MSFRKASFSNAVVRRVGILTFVHIEDRKFQDTCRLESTNTQESLRRQLGPAAAGWLVGWLLTCLFGKLEELSLIPRTHT